MNDYQDIGVEPKCVSRPGPCAQRQKIPAPNTSFQEVFYSYSTRSQKNELNRKMKNRIKELVEEHGYSFTTFSEEPKGTFQYFCNNICLKIQRSALLMGDVTPYEDQIPGNIIHEIGLAQGFRKNVILVTCERKFNLINSLISNLQGFEYLLFPNDLDEISDLIKKTMRDSLPDIHIINDAQEFQEYCLLLERKPFSRDFYSTIIPAMMRDDDLLMSIVNKRKIYPFRSDKIYTAQYVNMVNERRQSMLKILQRAKKEKLNVVFRDMYIKQALQEYAEKGTMEGKKSPDYYDEVITRFKGIIQTMKDYYPHYKLGLAVDIEAPYKFLIKHDCGVVIDNPIRRAGKDALAVFSTIKGFVNENQILFNKLWEMPNTEKDKKKVLEFLERCLNKAEKRKRKEEK